MLVVLEQDGLAPGGLNFGWPCMEAAYPQNSPSGGYQGVSSTETPNPNVICSAPLSAENPVAATAPALWWSHASGGGANPPGTVGNCAIGGVFYSGLS